LSSPFEGGNGPSHGAIERIWLSEDVYDYLPEGNKAERVRGGLKALRDGLRRPEGEPLPANSVALKRVAEELASLLVSRGFVQEEEVAEALEPPPSPPQPAEASPAPLSDTGAATAAGLRQLNPHPAVSSDAPIFVVHGHDHGLLHEVVRVLERATSRDVTVLHEQANRGRTVLEKFEAHAGVASYAVVLLTADDVGAAAGRESRPRGRQNVIFELGFFFGKLGRERVCVLLAEGVEQPSDIAGLVYIPLDVAGAWKYQLARELSAAHIEVALERIP
jgi:predicted nucleotide-binding protein